MPSQQKLTVFCALFVVLCGCKEVALLPPSSMCDEIVDNPANPESASVQHFDIQETTDNTYIVAVDNDDVEFTKALLKENGAQSVRPLLTESRASIRRLYEVQIAPEDIALLTSHPDVRYVEESGLYYADDFEADLTCKDVGPQFIPTGITKVEAPDVWSVTQGEGVVVIIIDSGIALGHPDFAPERILGGVCVRKDCESDDIMDYFGHGTHVAGIIGADDDEFGVVGVAPKVDFFIVKIFGPFGSADKPTVIAGINEAVRMVNAHPEKKFVVNMSFGGAPTDAMEDAIKALSATGAVLVASAGNHGDDDPGSEENILSPAFYDEVIAIAATAGTNASPFSVSSTKVEFTAPGSGVISDMPGDAIAPLNGTSMSAPHVTGAFALIFTAIEKAENQQCVTQNCLINILRRGVQDYGEPGRDIAFGFGEPRMVEVLERLNSNHTHNINLP
jgi:major intracellular serine protease